MHKAFSQIFRFLLFFILIYTILQGILLSVALKHTFTTVVSRELELGARQLKVLMKLQPPESFPDIQKEEQIQLFLEEFLPQVQTLRLYHADGTHAGDYGPPLENEERLRKLYRIPRITMYTEGGDRMSLELFPHLRHRQVKRPVIQALQRYFLWILSGLLISLPIALSLGYTIARRITSSTVRVARSLTRLSHGERNIDFPRGEILEYNMIARASEDLQKQLIRKDEIMKHRLQDLTHDLKSPIAGLYTQLESVELGAMELTEERFGHIYRELGYLNHLIDDMSELYGLESDQMPLNREMFPAANLADILLERYGSKAEAEGISIDTAVAVSELSGDPILLERALGNLLQNAIRYGKDGRISLRILSDLEGVNALVEVENPGHIPEEDIPYLFTRYWRKTRDRQGSGLGLSITDLIARKHGGDIRVTNLPGDRVVFTLRLPLATV